MVNSLFAHFVVLQNEQRGRTAQIVEAEIKASQLDELAEFDGDRPCQRKRGRLRSFLKQVVDSYHTTQHEQTGRTGQSVVADIKGLHVDELAEFCGDRPCQGR